MIETTAKKKSGGFSKMRKRLQIFRNLFFLSIFYAYVISVILFVILTSIFCRHLFILNDYVVFHSKAAWSRGRSEVSGAGGPGINSPVVLGGSFQI